MSKPNASTSTPQPALTQERHGGQQDVYRFPNGYGASVLTGGFAAYGGLEMAVVHFRSDDILDYRLVYDTPVTDDVLGYLSAEDVPALLDQVAALEPRS